MVDNQIVKSESKAYGYNYASLSDIVKQGFKIPIMETKVVGEQLYMGWLDDKNEWHQGAPVVVPEMKGSNKAQMTGAALTYARRFTAQMALGLACDSDKELETKEVKNTPRKVDFAKVREDIKSMKTLDDLTKYWNELYLTENQANVLRKDFTKRRVELSAGGINDLER